MNVFLLDPAFGLSCKELSMRDPVRARKQLVECCQVLACVDILRGHPTAMRKADGTQYAPTKSQLHHPICVAAAMSNKMYWLTANVALELAKIYPTHACTKSLISYMKAWGISEQQQDHSGSLLLVRRGEPHAVLGTFRSYAMHMRQYLESKWANA